MQCDAEKNGIIRPLDVMVQKTKWLLAVMVQRTKGPLVSVQRTKGPLVSQYREGVTVQRTKNIKGFQSHQLLRFIIYFIVRILKVCKSYNKCEERANAAPLSHCF